MTHAAVLLFLLAQAAPGAAVLCGDCMRRVNDACPRAPHEPAAPTACAGKSCGVRETVGAFCSACAHACCAECSLFLLRCQRCGREMQEPDAARKEVEALVAIARGTADAKRRARVAASIDYLVQQVPAAADIVKAALEREKDEEGRKALRDVDRRLAPVEAAVAPGRKAYKAGDTPTFTITFRNRSAKDVVVVPRVVGSVGGTWCSVMRAHLLPADAAAVRLFVGYCSRCGTEPHPLAADAFWTLKPGESRDATLQQEGLKLGCRFESRGSHLVVFEYSVPEGVESQDAAAGDLASKAWKGRLFRRIRVTVE